MENKSIASSFVWKLCERGASQLITIVVQIILARLLAPEDFGALAILVVFTDLANVFIQKGFASSIIRKKNATEDDYNTAFVVSEAIALVCVCCLFFASPYIASFYRNPKIVSYLRVLSLSLLFGALYSIENAVLVRDMKFKVVFVRSLAAAIISGTLGIICAYLGLGAWALIIQVVTQQAVLCVVTYFGCSWKPRLLFSRTSFTSIFSFGSRILIAELISIGVEDLRTLIIGKKYSSSDLAFYDRGQYYPNAAMRGLYDTISSVMLPVLSKDQDNKELLRHRIVQSVNTAIYLISPLFVGLAAVADLFVILLLTNRWEASIPFLRLFCIYQLAFPIYGIMRQTLYAIGNSTAVLKLEIARGGLFITAIIIGCMISPFAIAIATSIALYATTIIYAWYVQKQTGYDVKAVLKGIGCTALQCTVMYLFVVIINRLKLSMVVLFFLDIVLGAALYFALSVVLRNESYLFLKEFIVSYMGEKGNNGKHKS